MIKQDYKQQATNRSNVSKRQLLKHWPMHWGEVTAVAVGILLLGLALTPSSEPEPVTDESSSVELADVEQSSELRPVLNNIETSLTDLGSSSQRQPLALSWEQTDTSLNELANTAATQKKAQSYTVKSGDTLSHIFKKVGFSARDVYQVTQPKLAADYLTNLRPGKQLVFTANARGELDSLEYQPAINETLFVTRAEDGFSAHVATKEIEVREEFAFGIIESSLFLAGKRAGLSDNMLMQMADVFGYDIDFTMDIRPNDSFAILYERRYLDGELIGDGRVLAAQFVNQGDVFDAVRYIDKNGRESFFTPEGNSMRKAFMRNPVNFRYISSSFNPKRFHPILKRVKPHRGIDYRAKTGTPVYAAGDGKVIASSYNKYNGKYVFIQHGNSIVTKYLHLSKRMVSVGKRVKQGQTIGLVGNTGMSEAPHLHYEFVVNGVHRNPRTVNLPKAEPIQRAELQRFRQLTKPLLANLATRQRNILDETSFSSSGSY